MKLVDEEALDQFRGPGLCEWCGKKTSNRDPHHIFSKGAGRVDIKENIIALDRHCHTMVHSGAITRSQMLEIAAKREGTTPEEITNEVYRIRRSVRKMDGP